MTMMSLFGVFPAVLALALVSNVSASDGCFKITAAFWLNRAIYLVSGNDYIKLNEFIPEDVRGTMMDLFRFPGNVDAITNDQSLGQIKIYTGNTVYHLLYPRWDFGYMDAASDVSPDFATGVDAVTTFQGVDFIFKGCDVLTRYTSYDIRFDDLRKIGLPCNVDAAFSATGYIYVIKGTKYWVKRRLYSLNFEGPFDLRSLCWLPKINLCP